MSEKTCTGEPCNKAVCSRCFPGLKKLRQRAHTWGDWRKALEKARS